jgi:hypothetical protein
VDVVIFDPWHPMQTYHLVCSGDVEALSRAVAKLDGVVCPGDNTHGVQLVIPVTCDLDRLREMIKAEGGGEILWAAALGSP